ncbi:hypothetical protein NQ314_008142 [Rhamnusium bicolor]|uniref:Large ribosomal subunit protein uL22m n=1 Tax=Rhamnusium bicolor TaxID=1586634 RepID=A0AAV8YFI0_9CUCU|nr:hypothetical protein NQ314_008142 [Rhamnusium bicolor]
MALIKFKAILTSELKNCQPLLIVNCEKLHSSSVNLSWNNVDNSPKTFLKFNEKIYPPQSPDEEPRPAFVCHQRANIKYSPWKMWYIASFIRGMTVDEAIKQLKFVLKKGAKDVRETIEEAKELAVKEHNVEFPSNMWVGPVIKGIRRHARSRFGVVEYFHCHYFVRLEEGKPPKHYYMPTPKQPHEQLEDWLKSMRKRKITNSL